MISIIINKYIFNIFNIFIWLKLIEYHFATPFHTLSISKHLFRQTYLVSHAIDFDPLSTSSRRLFESLLYSGRTESPPSIDLTAVILDIKVLEHSRRLRCCLWFLADVHNSILRNCFQEVYSSQQVEDPKSGKHGIWDARRVTPIREGYNFTHDLNVGFWAPHAAEK